MDKLNEIGYSYIFPMLGKAGVVPANNMLGIERAVDQLIDNGRGNCGRWVYLWLQITTVQGLHGQRVRSPGFVLPGGQNVADQNCPLVTMTNPEGDTVQFRAIPSATGANFDKYADTWETIELKAINAATKKWRFGDHCYVEYSPDEQRIFYDPTYQKHEQKDDWFAYLNSILGTANEMAIKKPNAVNANDKWVRHRGAYFPDDVNWKTRDPNGPNFFDIQEL